MTANGGISRWQLIDAALIRQLIKNFDIVRFVGVS